MLLKPPVQRVSRGPCVTNALVWETNTQDMGNEVIATTSDGHVYASSSGGFSWFKRK